MTPEEAADVQVQHDRLAAYIREIEAGRINYLNGIEQIMLRRKLQELSEALAHRPNSKRSK